MLQHLIGIAAGTAAIAGSIADDHRPYEVLSATLDGRVLMAIVDHQGTAVAIDLTRSRPEIVSGLAAGVILSDLRDASEGNTPPTDRNVITVSSGIGISEVRVDGEVLVGRADKDDLIKIIEEMSGMPLLQQQQLRTMLGL